MAALKFRAREAYLYADNGVFYVLAYPSQKPVCKSKHLRRATRRARNLGFDVTVMRTDLEPTFDARRTNLSSFVLPATRPYRT